MDLRAIVARDERRMVPLSEEQTDIRDLLNLLGDTREALMETRATLLHIAADADHRVGALDAADNPLLRRR